MLFRLLLLLAIAGALTVFTLQNMTPLLPLVFFGIKFPALPLSWWVLGAIGAGVLSMLAIQILFGLSNFVVGQTVRSRVRSTDTRTAQSRWSASTPDSDPINRAARAGSSRARTNPGDDSAWQDWRGYESPQPPPPPRSTPDPIDDWERPPSDDWERPSTSSTPRDRGSDRVQPDNFKNFETNPAPTQGTRSGSTYSYSYREPQDSRVSSPSPPVEAKQTVVDADFRVIVPPYKPLDEPTSPIPPPPPPPPVEDNADDWFDDSPSDEFGETKGDRNPT